MTACMSTHDRPSPVSLAGCLSRRPRRSAVQPPCCAKGGSWLPKAPRVVVSTRKEDVRLEELLPLLRSALDAPQLDTARVAAVLANAKVIAAAFATNSTDAVAPQTSTGSSASLSWLIPRPPLRQLVGFARVSGDSALVAILHDVVVSPTHRRSGVGSQLVRSCLSQLRSAGIGDIGVVCPSHCEAPRAFFESCSFGPDKEGAVYMALPRLHLDARPEPQTYLRMDALREAMLRRRGKRLNKLET